MSGTAARCNVFLARNCGCAGAHFFGVGLAEAKLCEALPALRIGELRYW
jgi:hypothetical protein